MKLDPINIILNPYLKIDSDVYFISGNEKTLIEKIKDLIIKNLTKDEPLEIQKVNNLMSANKDIGLFSKKKLIVVSDINGLEKKDANFFKDNNDVYIFTSENSPKTNILKKKILNTKNFLVIDCYEISKESKINILNNFLNKRGLKIDEGLFLGLLDLLDDRYMLLERELEKIREIDIKNISFKEIKKIISNNQEVDDKIFFKLLDSNETIINNYNSKITNEADANKLYFVIKKFINLIISYENKSDFEYNIPKYLFREKKLLVSIFSKFTLKKKKRLINLVFNTDIIMRKNSGLSVVVVLRFLLNLKKIIIS
tara:strand:- start:1638 stop:2576 length:939 start_codon:yes stop_codon:yes gene_type:complete